MLKKHPAGMKYQVCFTMAKTLNWGGGGGRVFGGKYCSKQYCSKQIEHDQNV